ncbi:MAG: DegT/DnrJ/EryC1/StrS family aminotransferase [Acidobacteriota bacterium]
MPTIVPFYRPDLGEPEIQEVVDALRSGWLTTGPRVKRFEQTFAAATGASHAVALNSCTAALHLAVHALGLRPGDGVLVPALTFAATAEVVRYEGGIPILIDCDPVTLNMDLQHAESTLAALRSGEALAGLPRDVPVVGMIPVHVGGMMLNVDDVNALASRHHLWVVEDAAHAFPAAWRRRPEEPWQQCGEQTAAVSCFSFYANKTITTGEGGMAVTADPELAARMRLLSLHGLSHDAWGRYSGTGSWDYRILAPGYKYNMTDIAAAIGIHQLARAEEMRRGREAIAEEYLQRLADVEELELPPADVNRLHAWHLFPIRLRLETLSIDRNRFIQELAQAGVSCSVHWRPLHLHPYYEESFGWRPADLPAASAVWTRLVSLPLFSTMTRDEIDTVVDAVRAACGRSSRRLAATR